MPTLQKAAAGPGKDNKIVAVGSPQTRADPLDAISMHAGLEPDDMLPDHMSERVERNHKRNIGIGSRE